MVNKMSRLFGFTAAVLVFLSVGNHSPVLADDTEMYRAQYSASSGSGRPKVLIVFDDSGSMSDLIAGQRPPYDPLETYDGGVTFRPGARHGPMEIRQQCALMRRYHGVTRQAPFEQVRAADIGDVPMEHHYSIADTFDDITRFYERLHSAGVIPLTAGGDHSITYPIFRAIAKERRFVRSANGIAFR